MISVPSDIPAIFGDDPGPIYRVGIERTPISYPTRGNDDCNAIEDHSYWFVHRNRCLSSLLGSRIRSGVMLDVGGGNGSTTAALRADGIDCWLVEPGVDGCHNAVSRCVPVIINNTLAELALPGDSVGCIGLFDVIEHVPDVPSLLNEAFRVLAPDAVIAVTVPALRGLWSADDVYAGHHRRYSTHRLTLDLEAAGFVVDRCRYLFGPLVMPRWLFRTIPSLLRLRRADDVARAEREHGVGGGLFARIMSSLLRREAERIKRDRWPMLGTSCVAVAYKRHSPHEPNCHA